MARCSLFVIAFLALLAPCSFAGEEQGREPTVPFSGNSDRTAGVTQVLSIGGATIEVDLAPGTMDVQPSQIISWIERAARAVTIYYGRFPVLRVRVRVVPDSGQEDYNVGKCGWVPGSHAHAAWSSCDRARLSR